MGEVSIGLIWIRLVPGEKAIWVGGNLNEPPPPSIAHRFANTSPLGNEAVRQIMEGAMTGARRDIAASIDQALQRYDCTQIWK